MSATYWTLKYDGVEKSLEAWGICADYELDTLNKRPSTFTFRTTEKFDAGAAQFAFKSPVIIYRDRTSIGAGGAIALQGYFDDPQRVSTGGRQFIKYTVRNVLWLFERHPFAQERNQFGGWIDGIPSHGPILNVVVCTECFLGQKLDSSRATSGEQIVEVINWLNECFNPTRRGATSGMDATQDVVQTGTIDPHTQIPITRVNTIFCIEAIFNVLRWNPDAVIRIDETTTPPTIHVKTMAKWNYGTIPPTFIDYTNLPEVTVTISADQQKDIEVQSALNRQLPGVLIYYLSTDTLDDFVRPVIIVDKFPDTITNYTPEASRHTVEMEGQKITHKTCEVKVKSMALLGGSSSDQADWWLAHDRTLQDPRVDEDSVAVEDVEIVDEQGNPISLADYPYELVSTVPNWAKATASLNVIKAIIKANVSFNRYVDEEQLIIDVKGSHKAGRKVLKLTNAANGSTTWDDNGVGHTIYRAVDSAEEAEAIPENVAESVYRSAAIAQYAGKITFTQSVARSDIYVGCRLKLVGPTTTFSNILVQGVRTIPHLGTVEVTYGPSCVLDADALIELSRATRLRLIYNMPNFRADGGTSGSDAEDFGGDAELDDTSVADGGEGFASAHFYRA